MSIPIIHLFSGGIDSTVMLYELLKDECNVHCLFFQYGQLHLREWDYAKSMANKLNVKLTKIDIPGVFGKSRLTGDDSCSAVVPNRNMVFLSIAAAFAVKADADSVTIGITGSDFHVFHDCRSEFIQAMNNALHEAEVSVSIKAPYVAMTKSQVVNLGFRLGVDFKGTWSCYERGSVPCGKCLACKERERAFI